MKKIIIFGARGNGTVLTSLIESINEIKKDWEIQDLSMIPMKIR